MRTILILLTALLVSCASAKPAPSIAKKEIKPEKRLLVRITAYWKGQDYWTTKGIGSRGDRLMNAKSASVDMRLIPYKSKLVFFTKTGKKELIAVDTGTAVKSRLASRKMGKNNPVVDIFFNTRSAAQNFLKTLPKNQIVEIIVQNS